MSGFGADEALSERTVLPWISTAESLSARVLRRVSSVEAIEEEDERDRDFVNVRNESGFVAALDIALKCESNIRIFSDSGVALCGN